MATDTADGGRSGADDAGSAHPTTAPRLVRARKLLVAVCVLLICGLVLVPLQAWLVASGQRALRGHGTSPKSHPLPQSSARPRGQLANEYIQYAAHAASSSATHLSSKLDRAAANALYQGGRACRVTPAPGDFRVFMRERAQWTWGRRVCRALRTFAPRGVCWLDEATYLRDGADLELIHVDGEHELRWALNRTRQPSQPSHWRPAPFAIFQHGLSFADVSRERFADGWRAAVLTASFQDLSEDAARHGFAFLAMPWGADEEFFVPPAPMASEPAAAPTTLAALTAQTTTAATTRHANSTPPGLSGSTPPSSVLLIGKFPEEESLGTALFAAAHAGLVARHVGDAEDLLCRQCPRQRGGSGGAGSSSSSSSSARAGSNPVPLLCQPLAALGGLAPCAFHLNLGYVTDAALRTELQAARYVVALRQFEGFELAGVEALFCGSRPLVYDIPTYRWYKGHATFVPSGLSSEALFLSLTAAMREAPRRISREEMSGLRAQFSWQRLVPRFFERVRAQMGV